MSQKKLDRITDKVLADGVSKAVSGPLKVIAGEPDRPLIIGDIEIPCYVLEDETRALSIRGMSSGIGLDPEAGFRMPQFMATKALKPFVIKDILPAIKNPIKFKNPVGGGVAYGYPAALLVDVCNAILAARDAGVLTQKQLHIADRCDHIIRGLAIVGIIALVDEATGYQRIREERALATILERLIAKELNPWTRTFPFEFYEQICRLKDWPSVNAIKRPSVIGRYTNDFVYERLAPGVLDELKRVNPVIQTTGRRQHKHHQWFTTDIGHPKLQQHLWAVLALMRAASSWDTFRRSLGRAFPKLNETITLALEETDE